MRESSDREAIECGPWRQAGNQTAMFCCSFTVIDVFSLLFSELILKTMMFNFLPFEIKMASFAKVKAAIMQAQR